MKTAEAVKAPGQDMPRAGTKQFRDYKASVCEHALKIKKKMDKLAEMYGETIEQLQIIFSIDDKEFFSDLGNVKKDRTNSYSIDEQNIVKVKELLEQNSLTIDDYINQKTSWGVTAKLRKLLTEAMESENPSKVAVNIKPLVTVKTSESIRVKAG